VKQLIQPLFALCLFLGAFSANAQDLKITAKLQTNLPSQTVFVVGEPIRLSIEIDHPPGAVALVPEVLPLPSAIAERTEERKHVRTALDNRERDSYVIQLLAFEAGTFTIPSFEISFSSTVAKTRPLELEVNSDLTEQEQIIASSTLAQAIAELEKMAAPNPNTLDILIDDYTPLYILGGLILLTVLFFLTRWFIQKYKTRKKEEELAAPPPPPRPAHLVALERLEDLRTSEFLAQRNFKAYFVELSEIMRSYLGQRYDFDSVELTVFELLRVLRDLRTPGLDLGHLEKILNEADFVKFAKYTPTDVEAHTAINSAFELVERTAKKEEAVDVSIQ